MKAAPLLRWNNSRSATKIAINAANALAVSAAPRHRLSERRNAALSGAR